MALRLITALAVCLVSGFGGTAEDKPKSDSQLLQGSWDWDPAVEQPDAVPPILLERIVIKGNTLTFHYSLEGKKTPCTTEFKLDPKASPKEIDFTTTGWGKDQTYRGLYEVKDGQLKICYRGPGCTRPKNFDDKREPNSTFTTVFIVLKPTPIA